MALTKGTDSSVKVYARQMITEHTAAQDDLEDVVDEIDLDVNLSDTLAPDQVAMRNMLMGLSGAAFDSAYISGQITGHQKTLIAFDAELSGGMNPNVRQYATDKRPSIQAHLVSAETIRTNME